MSSDFIRDIIDDDLRTGKFGGRVRTRFPPEPNGYLHIGHAKSICLNFGIARDYAAQGAYCNLRMDDTNPVKEDPEYVAAIQRDIRWLGFEWHGELLHASDYFEEMYRLAEKLVQDGKAYVCHLSEEQIREYRGTLSEPGRPSPYRDRSPEENLRLLRAMRAGELPDGACVLRAKIDMASANMKMRDPLLYRIRHTPHDRTGDAWCIYPMYDYAHPLSDAIEGISHSICTLEFENNRELYDWVVRETGCGWRPQQIEFARLNLDYTVMSKRKLLLLVKGGHVRGWDDPRMPTIAAMRRRGYTPEAIRNFAAMVGVAKNNSVVDLGKLEFCVRDDLNARAPRALAVLRPVPVTLENVGAGDARELEAPSRKLPFSRRILIERDDVKKLAPGAAVRLRHGPVIVCDEAVADAGGQVTELRARVDEAAKPAGVIHWVSEAESLPCEVRLYERLFSVARPDAGGDDEFTKFINPASLEVVTGARVEPSVATAPAETRFQFERLGYFYPDPVDSRPDKLVFNRVIGLRETTAAEKGEPEAAVAAPAKSKKAATRPPRRSGAEYRAEARARDPELQARFERWPGELGIAAEDAELITGDRAGVAFFEAAIAAHRSGAASVARWQVNELPRAAGDRELDELPFDGAAFGRLVALVDRGTISAAAGKEVLAAMAESGGEPAEIVAARGLTQVSDAAAIERAVAEVLAGNAAKVAEYRGGRAGLLGFFVGQVMKATGGKANPKLVQELTEKALRAG